MPYDEILKKYPNLIRALQWVAILSKSEAALTIHTYKHGQFGYPEAVCHWLHGRSPKELFKAAWKQRHWARADARADA